MMSAGEKGVPVAMRKRAWMPMTVPTAMTIFQWLYLSSGLEPILEKRSEPLQKRMAMSERRNQFTGKTSFQINFIYWFKKDGAGGGLRGNRVLCQH